MNLGNRFKAIPFELSNVILTPNTRLYKKMMLNANYMLSLESDRLLYSFRDSSKLDTKGAIPYGGWEGQWSDVRGQFMGHYISSCLNMYESFKDVDRTYAKLFADRVNYLVEELYKCQIAISNINEDVYPGRVGIITSFSVKQLDYLEELKDPETWGGVPYYVFHKTLMGLVDAYRRLGNKKALEMATSMVLYFKWRVDKLSETTKEKMVNTKRYPVSFYREFGGMHEVLLDIYKETKNEDIFELSKVFDRKWFRDMLIEDRDELGENMEHANTEIPCVFGMVNYYETFGDESYRLGVLNFLKWMRDGHTFPTGGVSGASAYPDYGAELFNYPNIFFDHATNNEGHTNNEASETCCAHNLNKLSNTAFAWTLDEIHGNDFEKRFVNMVLPQQHPKTGMFVYHQNLHQGSKRHWGTPDDSFWCCYCSGIEAYSSLAKGAYYHKDNCLWINNYIDSTVLWKEQDVIVRQETIFPDNGYCKITLNLKESKELKFNIRIPQWATSKINFKLNGKELDIDKIPGTIITIESLFKNGDIIEFNFEYSLSIDRMPDRPEYVAVKYGPHVLVPCALPYSIFMGDEAKLIETLEPTENSCEFKCTLSTGEAIFKPVSNIVDEYYNGYVIISEPIKEHIVDTLVIGCEESQKSHNMEGENFNISESGEKKVINGKNGWISFDINSNPDKDMYIKCLYWGGDNGGKPHISPFTSKKAFSHNLIKLFDIQIFNEDINSYHTIATQFLDNESPNNWYHVIYPIPSKLTKGKTKLKVRLKAKGFYEAEGILGGIYDRINSHYYDI